MVRHTLPQFAQNQHGEGQNSTSFFLYAWFEYIAHTFFSYYYKKALLSRRKHENNAPTTIAFGLHHTGALNN